MKTKSLLLALITTLIISGLNFAANPPAKKATIDNLKSAITGETTASAKYAAYSKKAKEEGHDRIALLFEAASKAEHVHANNHRAALGQLGANMGKVNPEYEVKSTKENLQDAINGESYEVATMYPSFIKTAKDGGVNIAMLSFNYAYQVEKKHKALYKNALEKLNASQEDQLAKKYMVCTTCGNTYDGEAPKRCGISMTPRERFITIE